MRSFMSNKNITYRGAVYPWHCDQMGHMNVMWYAAKFDEASRFFLSQLGMTRQYLMESRRGMAAVQQNTSYKRELYAGDIVTINTTILEVGAKTVTFRHEMIDEVTRETAAVADLTGVFMDTMARKSRQLPPRVVELAYELMNDLPTLPNAVLTDPTMHITMPEVSKVGF